MKNIKKNATILLISLLVIAGSLTNVFEAYAKRTFTITVTLNPFAAGTISGYPYSVEAGIAVVQNNQDETISIAADEDYIIQALKIDGILREIGDYSNDGGATADIPFSRVKSDHSINVIFEVPAISTTFSSGIYETSEQILFSTPQFLPELDPVTPYYQVEITEGTLSGIIYVTVYYDESSLPEGFDENDLRLYIGNPVDFNEDGTVNGNDISLIQEEANKNTPQDLEKYDLNHDGIVNTFDVNIVKDYANSGLIINPGHHDEGEDRIPWIDITTSIDTNLDFVTGETWHLSIFGCR